MIDNDNHQFDEHDVRSSMKDIRMDAVERHLKELKSLIQDVSTAFIGNALNGNKGAIHDIDWLKKEVDSIKKGLHERDLRKAKKNKYIGRLESVLGILIVLCVSAIFKIVFKL